MISKQKFKVTFVVALAVWLGTGAVNAEPGVQVLTYSSMKGKKSLGEFIASHSKAPVEFVNSQDSASLLGRLRADKRRKTKAYQIVLGLTEAEYRQALKEELIAPGKVFDQSPFALIVDSQKLKPESWPKRWADLPKVLKKGLIVEDPRTSGVGVGWLQAIYGHKLLTPEQAASAVQRYYPTWSSAYDAFLKGTAPAVWSFRASEAYHRCNDKEPERSRYRAVPLAEGYPVQREYVAAVPGEVKPDVQQFIDLVLGAEVQSAIPNHNWMYAASTSVTLPACFREATVLKELPELADIKLQEWIDQWSLQKP